MRKLYDRDDIYDLMENSEKDAVTRKHFELVFQNKAIHSLLDVSIGTGSMTLPIADLGIKLYGSDLSQPMLDRCQKKCEARNISITLKHSDFRKVSGVFEDQFDCVASTGNSLGYVSNSDVLATLEQMNTLVKEGGYLYFDLRNWDLILRKKPRYYLYNPTFINDIRVNLVQFWDYQVNQTIDFNLLYTFEKDNRIFQKEIFQEHYHPVSQKLLLDKLSAMGYTGIEIRRFPIQAGEYTEECDWYCVIAKKGN